jgi:hypothetical protein
LPPKRGEGGKKVERESTNKMVKERVVSSWHLMETLKHLFSVYFQPKSQTLVIDVHFILEGESIHSAFL